MRIICLLLAVTLVFSCKKNDQPGPNYNSDKSRLTQLTDSLMNVYNNSVEGNKPGDYSVGARGSLKAALDLAAQVESGKFTQEEVNNAYSNLALAGQQFSTKLIQEVSAQYLVGHWKFNGNAADSSGHGHNGALKTGYVGSSAATATDGGTLPQLTADRFGRANMAYSFGNGSLIQVPYASELNSPSFTISLWVDMTSNSNGSYMISMNRWWGYKFNLNGTAVPFLTVATAATIYDRDAGAVNVAAGVWTHLAASYTDGTMKFYVNGELKKTWTNTPGAAVTLASPVDLSIGNEMPKEFYNMTDNSNPTYFWGASYFVGSMDDIRMYNKVLTDAEVNSIYIIEKDL